MCDWNFIGATIIWHEPTPQVAMPSNFSYRAGNAAVSALLCLEAAGRFGKQQLPNTDIPVVRPFGILFRRSGSIVQTPAADL